MAGKPIRLGKAAGELNVGLPTIVEFLNKKGVQVETNPNTKLEAEHYDMLKQEFAADQDLKEKSKLSLQKREKRETISLRDSKEDQKEAVKPVIEPTVVVEKPAAPVASVSTPEPEPKKVEEVKPAPVAEPVKAAEPVKEEKVAEPVKETAPEEGEKKVQVIGKIDLDKINSKTRPDKKPKTEEEPKAKVVAKPTPAVAEKKEEPKAPIQQTKEIKQEAPVVKEEPKAVEPAKPAEIETIRVQSQILTGPKVLGKIELPVEKPKSSNNQSQADRKKRKRIKKIDVDKQTQQQNQANTNQQGGGNNNNNQRPGQNRNNGNNNNNNNQRGNFKKGPHNNGPRVDKPEISAQDIQKEIKDTLARLSSKNTKSRGAKNRKDKRDRFAQRRHEEELQAEKEQSVLKLTEFVTVSELAAMMSVSPTQVISACMSLGIFASINQRLDAETIQIVADEFGYEVSFVSAEVSESIPVVEDKEEDLVSRPPIITVMGHVDHGKTSLLDRIRNANVTEGEAGGITQHIGAYSVTLQNGKKLTFLDTPGHEAFTAMRARGAQVTDVAIIIVAADDDVMPQTKEAISHAQAAGVPMIFAINKIDKPGANPDRIREQLSQMNILLEDWGGKYQAQEISAKQNLNIDLLLEKVLLEADMLELKANPNKNAVGTVIESSLDKGKGYVTTLMVEAGTLKIGDVVLVGRCFGKVRAMHDEKAKALKVAGPSTPVQILGIGGAPSAGDKFHVMDDEREARNIATKREQLYREQGLRTTKHITLDEIGRRLAIGDFKELNIIVKGDVDGSVEALSDSLLKLSTDEIQVNIVHKGVGAISEADINLASASDAIIIGFQVRPVPSARKLAEQEQIDIRMYSVIYKAIEEIKLAMEGMLSPDIEEKVVGTAEVREVFNITKVGNIAGAYVTDGIIKRANKIRLIRDGIVVHTGVLGSLKRFKDDVREVKNNYECGLNIEKFNDIKVGDIIESFEEVEVARKL